ncbi:hypothetical protein [Gemmatimonas sp.]
MTHSLPAPIGASSAAEWLSLAAARLAAMPGDVADVLATVAMLTATLERHPDLAAPSPAVVASLTPALATLPVQQLLLAFDHPANQWLQLSALAEHHGELVLARLIVDALAERLGEHDAGRAARSGMADVERTELLALCLTRRGRMARVAGYLDDAQCHFEEALALTRGSWRDARLAAELGLANLAVARGNYPQVAARCTALLANGEAAVVLAPVHRVALYQMRAIASRKRGAFIDALLDSWQAFDLLGLASAHRAELMVSMAETALECGDLAAAEAGFSSAEHEARATGAPLRVQVAAAAGTARVALARGTQAVVLSAAKDLDLLLRQPLAPRERAQALMTRAACHQFTAEPSLASASLNEARALAERYAFHDLSFGIEALRADSAATVAAPARRHPALARFGALAVMA